MGAQQRMATMQVFWTEVEPLSNLWSHRTIPCLELYYEFTTHLEDSAKGDMVIFMVEINRLFGSIDNYLFALEQWHDASAIPIEEKKRLGKGISSLCGESDFGTLLTNMQTMVTDGPLYSP